ncbi:hypothetical protein ABB37_04062 [Leptomonas pyrrhocoris]|uniref:Vacuolar protein sorting-associated protein 54 C-terminal domain-containing protein n=1 Tax=Leptomonas pyrrhocoris TaxID=157538 RepID=A0A0M9G400_LEPPY|nr:hypothetical protein ABB37_04062 [Leptomonas pyrrhocoris]KPA81783.1 hypothetical protein ABB37_04062 [Leptomonas pyrrhocoris]|eukprot:XP_015660222.1 hypothetical protein ABB37_04062 [Leptomonas pyrrhocoris]
MEQHANLTSSTHLNTSSASVTRTGHDAAASICAHLIVYNGLSRKRIAHAVGLPALVIEESIKNGVSSAILRAQLRSWLHESSASQKLRVPDELFAQLQEECAADEAEKQQRQRSGVDAFAFSALDPVSQAHFINLQQSVGQSFISILNDPGEPTANVDWSTWLGGKLYEAFDFNGRVGNFDDYTRNFKERQVGPESAAALLAEYPPNHDFSAYVKQISDTYQANRREGIANAAEEWRDEATDFLHGGRSTAAAVSLSEDGGPWPQGVPRAFFVKDYDPSEEMAMMSEVVGESTPALPPSPPAADAAAPTSSPQRHPGGANAASTSTRATTTSSSSPSATDKAVTSSPESAAMPLLSRIVDNTTFTDDFEYLEGRNKELRAWESAVEKCLLQHVKHRSEDFFATSQQFGSLSGDARSVLADAQVAREGGMRAGELFVSEYLRIGQLYRRRQNFVQLQRTATTAQRVLRRLGDVENWAALPERDFSEILAIVNALVDLEVAGNNADDSASSISWNTLSKLRCLAEVPRRVKAARKVLERVVLDEYARTLLSDLSEGDAGERVSLVCVSATRLGVLNAANQLYYVKVVEALQVAAQEAFVGFLMNIGTLDDKHANDLLAVVASNTVAFALPDARQQLCGFAKSLRCDKYQRVLQQFVDVLVDFVTQVSQNWGFFVTGGLCRALAMFDNQAALIEHATRDLFARVCGEAESLVASMLEVYAGGEQLSSTADVEQLVRISTQFPLRITNDVAGRLVSLLDGSTAASAAASSKDSPRRGSFTSGAEGEVEATSAQNAGEPMGFTVYRPTKVIGTTIQRLTKQFFRRQHKDNKVKITMVTEGETWVAKDTVSAAVQREVEEMCTLNANALEAFCLRAVRMLTTAGESSGSSVINNNGSVNYAHSRGVSSLARSANLDNTGELFDTDATKLYVRLPRSFGGATTTTPTTSPTYTFHNSSSSSGAAAHVGGVEEEEMEEGRLVANSLLVLMDLLHTYHTYMATFPFLAFDVASRMIELIDAYEGQAAAMVLGARAVEKKTLTTITTQHLCVASQCVSFLNDFIPALQKHLTAAVYNGAVIEAALAHRAPRDAVAVAGALGLLPLLPSAVNGGSITLADGSNGPPQKAKLFVENDWNRVLKNCRAHRNEFFSKMGTLVYRKVESLGSVSVQKNQWSVGGNEWVMAMLREVARLMRAVRPLLPLADMDGVVVPLIGMLSVMLREATSRIPVAAVDDCAAATSDMMLFKANVEKFGYDVLTCAKVTSVSAAMQGGQSFAPVSSEEAVLTWFLPPPATPSPPRNPTTAK